MNTYRKLNILWNNQSNTTHFKIIAWDAILKTKLMYGLESAQINDQMLKQLNTFQLKGFRKILRVVTTFIDKDNSNERVKQLVTNALNRENKTKTINWICETYKENRMTLAANIITNRHDNNDHRISITMNKNNLALTEYQYQEGRIGRAGTNKMRRGQPRNKLWITTREQLWEWTKQHLQNKNTGSYDENKSEHLEIIVNAANIINDKQIKKQNKKKRNINYEQNESETNSENETTMEANILQNTDTITNKPTTKNMHNTAKPKQRSILRIEGNNSTTTEEKIEFLIEEIETAVEKQKIIEFMTSIK